MKHYFLFILFGSLLLNSCKKEKTADIPALDGKWQLLSGDGSLQGEYYLFSISAKTVYYFSKDNTHYFKDFDKGVFNIKDDLLEMNLNGTNLYSFSVLNDTLTLTKSNYGTKIKMVRDNLAPATADVWIKPASILSQITDSFSAEGMSIYNGKIYSIISSNRKQMKVFNIASPSVVTSVDLSAEYTACEFVGNKLWVARRSDGKLEQIDYVNGSVLFTSGASGAFNNERGLCNNGVALAFSDNSSFYTYNIGSNSFSSSTNTPNNIRDMAYANGKYFVVTGNSVIHQINTSTLREEKSWRIENFRIDAIAFNGADCWIQGYYDSDQFSKYMKVSLP